LVSLKQKSDTGLASKQLVVIFVAQNEINEIIVVAKDGSSSPKTANVAT
jgi:hypothetical protein